MPSRILHCGKNLGNYRICIDETMAGFSRGKQHQNDIVYLSIRTSHKSLCVAKAKLDTRTDKKPWPDSDRYPHRWFLKDIEFCTPFNLKILGAIAGRGWGMKYLMSSNDLDPEAEMAIESHFQPINEESSEIRNLTNTDSIDLELEEEPDTSGEGFEIGEDKVELFQEDIQLMGTFQVINFRNESDKIMGLETLVNKNFHQLLPMYPDESTVLIAQNRIFATSAPESGISGTSGVPDALMLSFFPQAKYKDAPFKISLVEYECYGEGKTTALKRLDYLNGHIIPQLMRFASAFSVVTDRYIRTDTIERWIEKIRNTIIETGDTEKVFQWIKALNPGIADYDLSRSFCEYLKLAFNSNLQIILIIDELTQEQNNTMKNIIQAFKLENGMSIDFSAYVVRLEQLITSLKGEGEYALSVKN